MVKIALDTLGGDLGVSATLGGAKLFLDAHKGDEVSLLLVGKPEELGSLNQEIVPARDVVKMEGGALDALRQKDSSMIQAILQVKNKKADAVVSTGGTGVFLSAATVYLGRISGVRRAAFATPLPTEKDKPAILLDCGASNQNSGEEIAQFALMGAAYDRIAFGVEKPKCYLLSNGSEPEKGSPEGKEAYTLLSHDERIDFGGNFEANEVFSGKADVIATDGYSGNVLLKAIEGTGKMMKSLLKDAFTSSARAKLGYVFAKKGLKASMASLDPKKVGGSLLLGVNGVVVKAHGNSDAQAVYHALEAAYKAALSDLPGQIERGMPR